MKNQDFLDEISVIADFYDEVKDLHLRSGIANSATSTGTLAGGVVTTQVSLRPQRSNRNFVPVSREQVLCESVVHQLNAFWERYVTSYLMKQRRARCGHLFRPGGYDYGGTREMRVLTNCLKHKGKTADSKLAPLNPTRFSKGALIILRYDDTEKYMGIVKANITILGGQKRLT